MIGRMLARLSPEDRLILACAAVEADPSAIDARLMSPLRWDRFERTCSRCALEPLVYVSLQRLARRGRVPAQTMARLKEAYQLNVMRNAGHFGRLQQILRAFVRAGIDVIALKGVALAERVYGNIGLRVMSDIDLLVRRGQIQLAASLLDELGYTWERPLTPRVHPFHLPPRFSPDGASVVELHHHIFEPQRVQLDAGEVLDRLWRRCQAATIASTPVRVFAPTDMLLHVILHLMGPGPFLGMFGWVCDVAQICRCHSGELDWDELLDYGGQLGVTSQLYYALWLARSLLDAPIPPDTIASLESTVGFGPVARRALEALLVTALLPDDRTVGWLPLGTTAGLVSRLLGSNPKPPTAAQLGWIYLKRRLYWYEKRLLLNSRPYRTMLYPARRALSSWEQGRRHTK